MIKRNSGRLAAVIAVICMLLTMFSFSASAESGTVTYLGNSVGEGAGLYLIRIGSIADGSIVMDEPFAQVDLKPLEDGYSYEAMETAELISDIVMDHEEYIAAARLERMNMDGNAVWHNVESDAVYIIIQADGFSKCKITSSVFTSPMIVDGEVLRDVEIAGKIANNADLHLSGSVVVNKLGYKDKRLPGARFTFWEKIYYTNDDVFPENVEFGEDYYGKFYWKQLGDELETNENGQIIIEELPQGTYRFIETGAPEGYLLDESAHEFEITDYSVVSVENGIYVTEGTTLNIDNSVDLDNPPDEYTADGGGEEPPPEDSDAPVVIDDGKPQLTGDDIVKYVGIAAIVILSLGAIILLVVLGGKRDKKNK